MAEFDPAKQLWQRQVGAKEELPWTRGAVILQLQPVVALGAALTGGIHGVLGPWLTALVVLAFGYAIVWVDRMQLPDSLRAPAATTAWAGVIPPVYFLVRSERLRASGVERSALPLWVALSVWAVAVIVWIAVWAAIGTPWGTIGA